tara:strand:- start:41 stop:475 length:435 start_codon:yes stop_codon:yes gene_type:complete
MGKIYNTTINDNIENIILDYLNNNTFKNNKLSLTSKFSTFDFYNDEYKIELKSRSCTHDTYPTLMMNTNKLKWANDNPNFKCIFYFLFTDGLYKWDFKNNYTKKIGGRRDRNDPNDIKIIGFIPRNDLILVNDNLSSGLKPVKK